MIPDASAPNAFAAANALQDVSLAESFMSEDVWRETPSTEPTTPSAPNASGTPTDSSTAPTAEETVLLEILEADRRNNQLREGALYEILKRDIRRLADAMERADDRMPVRRSLADELALPDDDQLYAIDRILPLGGNALFAGRYKAGKTTFNGQLLKSWADGDDFLGTFKVYPDPDRPVVTIFNYEMSEGQFRRWLRRVGISAEGQRNVHVVHLRGLSLPLALPETRKMVAGWLRDARTGLWIVDPASRAMAGLGDGDSNADVGLFVSWLDEIKLDAGVRDLVLNIHMGHASTVDKDAERAIGAQAWSAWADALWFLNKDKDGVRWFWADGRDVDVDKMAVNYRAEDMSVSLLEQDPVRLKWDRMKAALLGVLEQEPDSSWRRVREIACRRAECHVVEMDELREQMVRTGEIICTTKGKSKLYRRADGEGMLDDS